MTGILNNLDCWKYIASSWTNFGIFYQRVSGSLLMLQSRSCNEKNWLDVRSLMEVNNLNVLSSGSDSRHIANKSAQLDFVYTSLRLVCMYFYKIWPVGHQTDISMHMPCKIASSGNLFSPEIKSHRNHRQWCLTILSPSVIEGIPLPLVGMLAVSCVMSRVDAPYVIRYAI